MKRMSLGAFIVLFASGCHVSTGTDHTLVSNLEESVPAGGCAAVEGPFNLPSGATNDYTVTDIDGTDDMDVTVLDDADGCDFTRGYGALTHVASVSSGTGSVPDGAYDFVVRCHNAVQDCIFSLTWTASY